MGAGLFPENLDGKRGGLVSMDTKKTLLIAAVVAVAAGALAFFWWYLVELRQTAVREPEATPVLVGFSLGTLKEERWVMDRDIFVKRAGELGAEVIVEAANSDADEQLRQAEKLINQGVQVLVVVPQDGELAAEIVNKAHAAGVKVIAYDRLIKNSELDRYVSFDNVEVGRLQARGVLDKVSKGKFAYIGGSETDNNAFLVKQGSMEVLQPLVEAGDIEIVLNTFTPNWQPDLAYKTMKDFLAAGGQVDAVVAANDGTAYGVIRALDEKGLAGKVPVSGQDAELSAVRRLIAGTQTVTVYKPISMLAVKAAEMAVALANGQPDETNNAVNNGAIEVPSYLIAPLAVTSENVDSTVIADGFHDREEVYGLAN